VKITGICERPTGTGLEGRKGTRRGSICVFAVAVLLMTFFFTGCSRQPGAGSSPGGEAGKPPATQKEIDRHVGDAEGGAKAPVVVAPDESDPEERDEPDSEDALSDSDEG
jgi:hypothetical protein